MKPTADELLPMYECRRCDRCNRTPSFCCGVRLTRPSVHRIAENHVPAFFEAQPENTMGDISCWSPSGELFALGFARDRARRRFRAEHWESIGGEGAIIILSRQGTTSQQYEQCIALKCAHNRQYDSVAMRALEFSPSSDDVLLSLHRVEYDSANGDRFYSYLCVWCNDGERRGSAVNYLNVQVIQYEDAQKIDAPSFLFFLPSLLHVHAVDGNMTTVWKYNYAEGGRGNSKNQERRARAFVDANRLPLFSTPSSLQLCLPFPFSSSLPLSF